MMMGMGDVSKQVVPKIGLLAPPRQRGTISSRYFVPYSCHKAHAVTGAVCVASACAIDGTVASRLAPLGKAPQGVVRIEHPSGMIAVDLDVDLNGRSAVIRRAALIRTARRLFQGEVLIPAAVWAHSADEQRTESAVPSAVAA
jgi:2-methylaconitate cis-trans-isomerase PrpF